MRSTQPGLTTVFVCKHGRSTIDACITDFEEQCGFTYLDVESDENNLSRAMELYYKLVQHNHTSTYQVISKTIHHYITEHNMALLEENEVRNNKAGDILPYITALALGVRIHLYELKPGRRNPPTKKYITCNIIQDEDSKNTLNVYLLRTNRNHYGLLLPTGFT